jgi:dienelactone hydrolase/predicted choloylglycine hydrolase
MQEDAMKRPYLLACAIVVLAHAFGSPLRAEVLARHGPCYLERVEGKLILHLKGTYREMGFAHGKLLAKQAAENGEAFLDHWCVGKETPANLRKIFDTFEPFLPERYKEEMSGFAEGSGLSLERIQLLHAIPERFHCTGAAAMGSATRDGKLYHTRSLDYALDIGNHKRVQDNALVIIYEPTDGHPYMVVGWAGFLGCVSGMNAKGISIGEMGSGSKDENYAGIPMIFMLREALRQGGTLEEALTVFRTGPRTCGYNFIVADGKIPDARAIEVTRSHIAEFKPGDAAENVEPHTAIPNCVRRCNHFVCEKSAATQRKTYDPRQSSLMSWLGYWAMTNWLKENQGQIDGPAMIRLLRLYPAFHPCLHQVVFCPSSLDFWVSNAEDGRRVKNAGAQNQPFHRYNLAKLLAGEPAERYLLIDTKARPILTGKVKFEPKGDQKDVPERYRLPAHEFTYEMQLKHDLPEQGFRVYDVRFPSPVQSPVPENNMVHGEFYVPTPPTPPSKGGDDRNSSLSSKGGGDSISSTPLEGGAGGGIPAVVLLDILQGNQAVTRFQATILAQQGVAALTIHMAYYGPRRPANLPIRFLMPSVEHSVESVRQTVLDVRRAAAWLESRPEVDRTRLGVMGTSLGSFIGCVAAQMEPRFSRVVLLLGGGGLVDAFYDHPKAEPIRKLWEALGGTKEKLAQQVAPADPLTCACNLKDRKVLMFGAKRDDIVPPKCTERLWEACGKPRIIWYDCSHVGAAAFFIPAMQEIVPHLQGK